MYSLCFAPRNCKVSNGCFADVPCSPISNRSWYTSENFRVHLVSVLRFPKSETRERNGNLCATLLVACLHRKRPVFPRKGHATYERTASGRKFQSRPPLFLLLTCARNFWSPHPRFNSTEIYDEEEDTVPFPAVGSFLFRRWTSRSAGTSQIVKGSEEIDGSCSPKKQPCLRKNPSRNNEQISLSGAFVDARRDHVQMVGVRRFESRWLTIVNKLRRRYAMETRNRWIRFFTEMKWTRRSNRNR